MVRWSKEYPTEAGWYWWRRSSAYYRGFLIRVLHVIHRPRDKDTGVGLYALGHGRVAVMGGEWAGPIETPEEG